MKRIIYLVTVCAMVLCIAGCGGKPDSGTPKEAAVSKSAAPQSLRSAIEKGDVQSALASISAGANVMEMYEGEQLIHLAAKSGKKDIVEALVANGADPKLPTQRGYTALHLASSREVAEFLIQHGLDVNQTSTYRETPLFIAADSGHLDVVDYLLSKGANPKARAHDMDVMPLNYAANRAIAERLVAAGAPAWGETNQWGRNRPPLWSAASKGRTDVVNFIMEKGIPPPPQRGVDEYISMALFSAVHGRHSDAVDAILSKSGKVDGKKTDEFIVQSVRNSDTNTVQVFLAKGGKSAEHYCNPLIEASRKGDAGLLKMILDAGGSAAAVTSTGYTPLHAAAAAGSGAGSQESYLACLTMLLSRGADAKTQKKTSRLTPLHLAAAANFTSGAKLLVEHGADVNAVDEVSSAPLHWAVINNAVDVAAFLLSKGANPNLALSKQAVVQTHKDFEVPNPFGGQNVAAQVPLTLAKSDAMKELLRKNGATESAPPSSASPPVASPAAPVSPPAGNTATTVQPQPPAAEQARKVRIGDTESDVISILGSPKGRIKAGGETTLYFKGSEITLSDGKVTSVTGKPAPK